MIPLHHCNSCGFLSTRGDQFQSIQRVRFCLHCIEGYEDKREPVYGWVCDKLPTSPDVRTHADGGEGCR